VLGVDITSEHPSLAAKRNWHFLQVDLTDEVTPNHIVAQTLERFGPRVDVLANVAGVMDNFGSLDSLTDASLQRCLAVNVTAPIRLSRAVIANMRQHRSGSIVSVASKAGNSGGASGIAYTASAYLPFSCRWRNQFCDLPACVVGETDERYEQANMRSSEPSSK
jgi:NAD(P)-dependent dehydrogenase (short-subunit alcohol dehydrogenase family)